MNRLKALNWFKDLTDKERSVLVELLYSLDLNQYLEIDKEGKYIKLLD